MTRLGRGLLELLYMILAAAGLAVLVLPLSLLGVLYWGWAFSTLWGWFAVPLFHVTSITTWQAAGLMTLMAFWHSGIMIELSKKPDADGVWSKVAAAGVIGPLGLLLLGLVIRHFM